MKEEQSNGMWVILESILQLGQEQLACKLFKLFMSYTFMDALRHAPVPVVLTSFEYKPESLRSLLSSKIDKAWGSVAVAFRCEKYQLSHDCFIKAINEHYRFATETAIRMANNKHKAAQMANYLHLDD